MEHADLAREIANATCDESRWPAVMARLASLLGARGAYLFTPRELSGARSFGATHELPREMSELYFGQFHTVDLLYEAARARQCLDAGSIVCSHSLVPDAVFRDSILYNEFLRPFDMYYCMGGVLTDEQDARLGPRAHIVFWRPQRRAAFQTEDERRLASVFPQLQLALKSHWRLRSQGLLGEWNEQLLAQIDQPFLLLSRGGRILYGNQAGLNLIRDCRGLRSSDGILCRGEGGQPLIEQFDALSQFPVALAAMPPDCPAMRIVPLTQTQSTRSMFHWFPRAAYVVLPQAAALRSESRGEQEFVRRYRLTTAEQQVLALLVEGNGPREVALAQGLSVHTVRAHLAHIFAKTGFRNQRELLAAVMRARLNRG